MDLMSSLSLNPSEERVEVELGVGMNDFELLNMWKKLEATTLPSVSILCQLALRLSVAGQASAEILGAGVGR